MATVEHSPSDTSVLLEVGVGVVPAAGAGEGAGAVGEQDGPQPYAEFLVVVLGLGAGRRGNRQAVDDGIGARSDGLVEGFSSGVEATATAPHGRELGARTTLGPM